MAQRGGITVRSSRRVYDHPLLRVREDDVVLPDGSAARYAVIDAPTGAAVLPFDDADNVFLARQYRHGIAEVSLEAFGGAVEPGETPEQGARRELEEELGMVAGRWTYLGAVRQYTAFANGIDHLFVARQLSPGRAANDPGEAITRVRTSLEQAVAMVLDGRILHAASCVLLLRAARLAGR